MRAPALALIVAAVLALPAPALADGMFRSPSGAIGCAHYDGVLRCDVDGGVKPLPPAPKACNLDWGPGFNLRAHGAASIVCAGDTARDPRSPIVGYGRTWHAPGITCSSSANGMRCVNADRHGFLISRGQAFRF